VDDRLFTPPIRLEMLDGEVGPRKLDIIRCLVGLLCEYPITYAGFVVTGEVLEGWRRKLIG
jgi:hypothetical protein